MKYQRLILLLSLLIMSAMASYGQDVLHYTYEYAPVSPSSEGLMRRIQTPVSGCTGTANVSIPLYTITCGDISLPISLHYNTSGVKVEDLNDIVGVGWNLNYGPSITRGIEGRPDEKPHGYLWYYSNFNTYDIEQYEILSKGEYDLKPDVFYYSTLTDQGKFLYARPTQQSEQGKLKILMKPINGTVVKANSFSLSSGNGFYNGFTLYDLEGRVYKYGDGGGARDTTMQFDGTLTGWKITSITDINQHEIMFQYGHRVQTKRHYFDTYIYEQPSTQALGAGNTAYHVGYWKCVDGKKSYYRYTGASPVGLELIANFEESTAFDEHDIPCDYVSSTMVKEAIPTEISFPHGRISFSYVKVNPYYPEILSQMKVYEGNTCIQTIDFTYYHSTYVGEANASYYRSVLTKVQKKDELTGKIMTFQMTYHNMSDFGAECKAVDWWGYYNGHTENQDRVHRQEFVVYDGIWHSTDVIAHIGNADHTPNENANAWSLHEITYPNGLKETFEYENNTADASGETVITPGIRIKKITSTDGNGTRSHRMFEYTPASNDYGRPNFIVEMTKHIYDLFSHHTEVYVKNVQSDPVNNPFSNGMPTLYREALDYDTLTSYDATDAPRRHLQRYNLGFFNYPSASQYTVINSHSDVLGREVTFDGRRPVSTSLWPSYDEYTYTSSPIVSTVVTRVRDIKPKTIVVKNGAELSTSEKYEAYQYEAFSHDIGDGPRLLLASKKEYRDYDAVPVITTYTYDSSEQGMIAGAPVRVAKTNSNGTTDSTAYTYPYHYGTTYSSLLSMNRLNDPVTVKRYLNGTLAEDIAIDYTGLNRMRIRNRSNDGGQDVTVEQYKRDALNNIKEIQKADGSYVTLLWGYGYTRLVCIIEGADYDTVMSSLPCSYASLQHYTDDSLLTVLANLQGIDKPWHATAYQHDPLLGITAIVYPNGFRENFSYDGFGRLTESRDGNNAILQYYQYQTR